MKCISPQLKVRSKIIFASASVFNEVLCWGGEDRGRRGRRAAGAERVSQRGVRAPDGAVRRIICCCCTAVLAGVTAAVRPLGSELAACIPFGSERGPRGAHMENGHFSRVWTTMHAAAPARWARRTCERAGERRPRVCVETRSVLWTASVPSVAEWAS
eukprot:1504727-Prymnesium_polylepis.2